MSLKLKLKGKGSPPDQCLKRKISSLSKLKLIMTKENQINENKLLFIKKPRIDEINKRMIGGVIEKILLKYFSIG